jgi:hypothetical protein
MTKPTSHESSLCSIDTDLLAAVQGGGENDSFGQTAENVWQGAKDTWQGAKNFGGGVAGGMIYGPGAKSSQIERFTDTNSEAGRAGTEIGMMGNMAMGPAGKLMSAGAGALTPDD